jgi:hypothetical protein
MAADSSGTAILSRVLEAHVSSFTPEAAWSILQLKFDEIDLDRMNILAERNRYGALTEAEQQELQSYLLVGHLLDLLAIGAQANRLLNRHGHIALHAATGPRAGQSPV